MDPDACLAELRALAAAASGTGPVDLPAAFDLDRFGKLFEALDGWLSRRGSLPGDWAVYPPLRPKRKRRMSMPGALRQVLTERGYKITAVTRAAVTRLVEAAEAEGRKRGDHDD